MPDRPVSLVVWHDEPPGHGVKVLTSRGLDAQWYEQPPYTSDTDYLWCIPSPPMPGDDALTLDDLTEAAQVVDWLAQRHEAEDAEPFERDFYAARYRGLAARLRRAIEAAERKADRE